MECCYPCHFQATLDLECINKQLTKKVTIGPKQKSIVWLIFQLIFQPCCRRQAQDDCCRQCTSGGQCSDKEEDAGGPGSPQPTHTARTSPKEHPQEVLGGKPFLMCLSKIDSGPALPQESCHQYACTGCHCLLPSADQTLQVIAVSVPTVSANSGQLCNHSLLTI